MIVWVRKALWPVRSWLRVPAPGPSGSPEGLDEHYAAPTAAVKSARRVAGRTGLPGSADRPGPPPPSACPGGPRRSAPPAGPSAVRTASGSVTFDVVEVGAALADGAARRRLARDHAGRGEDVHDDRQVSPARSVGAANSWPPRASVSASSSRSSTARTGLPRRPSAASRSAASVHQVGDVVGQRPLGGPQVRRLGRLPAPGPRSPPRERSLNTFRYSTTLASSALRKNWWKAYGDWSSPGRASTVPGLGLAELRAVGLRQQRRRQRVHPCALGAPDQLDPGRHVAPLVGAARLQRARRGGGTARGSPATAAARRRTRCRRCPTPAAP